MNREDSPKLAFVNDYCEAAHPAILKRMSETALQKNQGYGNDSICASASDKIRKACECPEAEVYYLVGGTQTNLMVIDTMLQPYEGVVAATSGHVSVHEAGAIEFTGHKVLTLPEHDGKIDPRELDAFVSGFYADGNYEHMVFPGMVYISHPTEYGTLYGKAELEALRSVCERYKLPLYMDGARLSYALAATEAGLCDLTLPDIARLTDAFYIGGTKCGALFGEALVFTKNNMPAHFCTRVKQHGAMLAKGWLLGLQFDTLFEDDLYVKTGANAIRTALKLKKALADKGYKFFIESPTNQTIVIVDNKKKEELAEKVDFSFWENIDADHTAIRFCTSWGTLESDIDKLTEIL